MDHKQIIEQVDETFCLDFLSKMVQFKSYSATEGEQEIALFMQAQMAGLGLQSELEPIANTNGRVNVIGRWPGKGGGKSLLFNGPPCFYGTDAAHFLHMGGMEGIVCGPGGRLNTMPDERVDIPDFLDMVKIYILTILEICQVA